MKQTVTLYDFQYGFNRWETYKNNFTDEALKALFEYLEEYEESTGEEIELDIVALCCEYSEYDSAWDAMEQVGNKDDMPTVDLEAYSDAHNGEGMSLDEVNEEQEKLALEWLQEHTQVIPVGDTGRVIIQEF